MLGLGIEIGYLIIPFLATSLLKHTYVQKYRYILNINMLFGAMPLQGHQSEW